MALKPAGSATQRISWSTAPTISARTGDVGVPGASTGGFNLRQWIKNPQGKTITYALTPGYSYPTGFSGTSAGIVNWNGSATPVEQTKLKWRATQQNPSYFVDSPEGWVEAIAPAAALPVAATNVQATPTDPNTIDVTWVPGSGGSTVTAFRVYYSDTGTAPYTELPPAIVPPAENIKTDATLQPNQQRWYMVVAEDANGATAQSVAVQTRTPFAKPAKPINLTAASSGPNSIHVEWADGSPGTATVSYRLEASETGVEGTFAVIQSSDVIPAASPEYDHTGLDPGETRFYRVCARDAQGVLSDKTASVPATTDQDVIKPATPINLTADTVSSTEILLTWQMGEGGPVPTEFRVYKSTTAGGPYGSPIGTVSAAAAITSDSFNRADSATLGASWTGTGGTTRRLGIASNTAKKTASTAEDAWEANTAAGWPADQYSEITLAATGSTLGSGVGCIVRLSPASNFTGYWLPVSGGGWRLLKIVGYSSFTVLASGTTPTFTAGDVVRLSVTGSATAVLRGSKNGVEFLNYSDSTNAITTGNAGIGYHPLDTTAAIQSWAGGGNFQHPSTGLNESTRYYYVVTAYDGTTESDQSVERNALTYSVPPATPSIISVVAAPAPNAQTALRVTWAAGSGANTSPTTYYQLFSSATPGGSYLQVPDSGNITGTSFDDDDALSAGESRSYKVKAFDAQNDASNFSAVVTGTTAPALTPAIPVSVTVTGTNTSTIQVSWQPGSGGSTITKYRIYRSSTQSGTYTQIPTIGDDRPLTPTVYDNTGLPPNTPYWYQVKASDATGAESNGSVPKEGRTLSLPSQTGWPTQGTVSYTPAVRNRRGFAMDTRHAFTGGVNPAIYRVNSTTFGAAQASIGNNEFRGGLGPALSASGNRIIVFETSGSINLGGAKQYHNNGNLWIAAQTAPAPGITLYNGAIVFQNAAGNCLFQHLRVHPQGSTAANNQFYGIFIDGSGQPSGKFVFDHCEVAHATDTTMGCFRNVAALDLIECSSLWSWDEGSNGAVVPISEGSLFNFNTTQQRSIQGCYQAHQIQRAPLIREGNVLVANNLNFDCGHVDLQGAPCSGNVIGNLFYKAERNTQQPIILRGIHGSNGIGWGRTSGSSGAGWDGVSRVWLQNNAEWNGSSWVVPANQWEETLVLNQTANGYFSAIATSTANGRGTGQVNAAMPAGLVPWTDHAALRTYIIAHAGARPNNRSPAATKAFNDFPSTTGLSVMGGAPAPAPDTSLTVNSQVFTMPGSYGASHFANSATESGRKAIESYLLDLGEAV